MKTVLFEGWGGGGVRMSLTICIFSIKTQSTTKLRFPRNCHFTRIFLPVTSHGAHREVFSVPCQSKLNFDCNYTFLIDLAPNGILYSFKSIEKVYLQSLHRGQIKKEDVFLIEYILFLNEDLKIKDKCLEIISQIKIRITYITLITIDYIASLNEPFEQEAEKVGR